MKKLMFAAAALAAGFAVADVTSANVVGYYNVDVKAGKFSMIALNIDPMNEKNEFTLDELFPYNDKMSASTASGSADRIQTWDYEKQTYRFFFMWKKLVKGKPDEKTYHWVEDVDGNPLAIIPIKTGNAVFYYALANDNTFSVPGQVPAEAVGILKQGFNMIGAGFPTQWNPNDAGTEFWSKSDFASSSSEGSADRIQYWDAEKQSYRFFFLWKKLVKGKPDEKTYKWVENTDGNPVLETPLTTGEGFFYYRLNAGEIEFKPGLKL